jgi:2-C-methyl-D-erythritol 2,4-cyclodiphosphate synthase
MKYRIGNGFDAHRFKPGTRLVLGGVQIPYEYGMEAHSDGDVVLHALCDAILGALARGDIGKHFPDTDKEYAGIDSRILLRKVRELMLEDRFKISNIDITIIAQAPKLATYVDTMLTNIADDLEANPGSVSVKATTTEEMGFTGRREGIAVLSSVLLVSTDS